MSTKDVKYIVLTRHTTGELDSGHQFKDFMAAQEFAQSEARRLLTDGPVIIFKQERAYQANVELQEVSHEL